MAKKPETVFKEKVLSDLEKVPNTYAVKIQQQTVRGIPDLFLCVAGHFVAIELKRDAKEKPDPLQAYNLDKIGKCGGYAMSVDPLSWPGALAIISKLALNPL